ncbi:ABC-type multidrug transport system fused ATPase/permease subunit [Anaerotaenia torta]|uniref:ABC transporter transmembrane domain-containing protein n=1 Tax=Anaerotaenia torta TaxID=433293 RepID=UPI003D20611F
MRDLKKLFCSIGGVRRFILLTLCRCPFDALNTALQASFLHYAFRAMNSNHLHELYVTCAMYGIGSLLLFLYNGTVWSLYAAYVIKWVGVLRRKLFEHIAGLSLRQIEAGSSGDWITRLNSDVQAAAAVLNQSIHLPHAAVALVNIIVSSAILVVMNPSIYGLVLLFLIPHMLISRYLIAKPMTKLSLEAQQAAADNTTDMAALITCADTAILYDARGFLTGHFEESSLRLRRANMRMRRRNALGSGIQPLMGLGGYLVILLLGSIWIADGRMNFSDLTAAFQYRGGLLVGGMMLMNSLINMKAALAGVKRINETMEISLEE